MRKSLLLCGVLILIFGFLLFGQPRMFVEGLENKDANDGETKTAAEASPMEEMYNEMKGLVDELESATEKTKNSILDDIVTAAKKWRKS